MINIDDVAQVAPYLEANLSFFGHTHVQGVFICHTIGVQRIQGPGHDAETVEIEIGKSLRYLVNPGSVGQPRDGDPRAGYAIYDSEQRVVTLHRVAYDVQGAQKQIVDAGLPGVLALRLATGN